MADLSRLDLLNLVSAVPEASGGPASPAASAPPDPRDGRLLPRVLVVDDTAQNRELAECILREHGFEVCQARSGEEALRVAPELAPDLVLLDVRMPGLDGFETCRRLREQPGFGRTPVIFMTSLGDIASRLRGFEVGGVDYLAWPFDPREVVARVSTQLAMRRLERDLERRNAELTRTQDSLRALATHLDAVREEERAQLSRDLHDDTAQLLTALRFALRAIEDDATAPPGVVDRAVSATELLDTIIEKLRGIANELRPVFHHLGLGPGLHAEARVFQERHGIPCELQLTSAIPAITPDALTTLHRITQEALTNVARHADARRVALTAGVEENAIVVRVEDDGRGFDPAAPSRPAGLGLLGMKERAERLRGTVEIRSRPGGGTVVTARLPL
jgi:signal transduction histidine kinase